MNILLMLMQGLLRPMTSYQNFFIKEKLPPHDTVWDFTVEELQAAKVL